MTGPGNRPVDEEEGSEVELLTIGQFSRLSQLSAKALRLYDERGVLVPARVDEDTGYRWYGPGQVEQARLVALLRQLGVPLAEVKEILGLEPAAAADRVTAFWAAAETDHGLRRRLASHIVDLLNGTRSVMHEVATRELPTRSLLCLKRHVGGQQEVFALGKEAIAIFRERPAPSVEGAAGSPFLLYYGEVSEDSDGPVEWCRPVPGEGAEEVAAGYPELTLRTEPAHEEAYVHLGPAMQPPPAEWLLVGETLLGWAETHHRQPSDLGVRVTYRWPTPPTAGSGPEIDFALPLADGQAG